MNGTEAKINEFEYPNRMDSVCNEKEIPKLFQTSVIIFFLLLIC